MYLDLMKTGVTMRVRNIVFPVPMNPTSTIFCLSMRFSKALSFKNRKTLRLERFLSGKTYRSTHRFRGSLRESVWYSCVPVSLR